MKINNFFLQKTLIIKLKNNFEVKVIKIINKIFNKL